MKKIRRVYFKEWRTRAGLSQTQVAQALGMHRGHISKLESDNPSLRVQYSENFLSRVADLYGCVSIFDLYVHPSSQRLELTRVVESIPDSLVVDAIIAIRKVLNRKTKTAV